MVKAHAMGHGRRYAIVTYCHNAQLTLLKATRADAAKHERILLVLRLLRSVNSVSDNALFQIEESG